MSEENGGGRWLSDRRERSWRAEDERVPNRQIEEGGLGV